MITLWIAFAGGNWEAGGEQGQVHPSGNPKIPILICYQAPEGDLQSKLTILFDACCSINLHIKSLFTLCSGRVQMFAKIAEHHR